MGPWTEWYMHRSLGQHGDLAQQFKVVAQLRSRTGYSYSVNESEYQDPEYEDLLRAVARRGLNPEEKARLKAWMAAHPETLADWVAEERLTQCLMALPSIQPSSNFTAGVMRRVDRFIERHPTRHAPSLGSWVRRWRVGWQLAGALGVMALVVSVSQYQAHQRTELARSLEALPAVRLAEVDLWRDFESINSLPAGPVPSVDQLAEAFK